MQKISIYFHWPFCISKCPYCDFNSVINQNIEHDKWQKAYIKAIDYYANYLQDKVVQSIFFGGGTPSLAHVSMMDNIIQYISKISNLDTNIEITLEANPTSVEVSKFYDFRQVGINRISLGIQSLIEKNLTFLGRNHSLKEVYNAIKVVENLFSNYSFDFIYALPQQSLMDWKQELLEIITLNSKHLSLYQLTIEQNTKFGFLEKQGLLKQLSDNISVDMFNLTNDIIQKYNLHRYEVSNHAQSGYESIHNLNYWLYGNYIGIGPNAHGRYVKNNIKYMTIDTKSSIKWINKVLLNGNGIESCNALTTEEERIESIIMGMRTIYGVNKKVFKNQNIITDLIQDQLIEVKNDYIRATNSGLLVLNSIVDKLI